MMRLITATHIKNWAENDERRCQDTLPLLLRRLIWATTGSPPKDLHFPTGDSVVLGGWDGRLETPVVFPYFPDGISRWEIGTGASPGVKAEQDFAKRSKDPHGANPQETTFVFVTPRPWPEHADWVKAKKDLKIWKDVRVVNADALEAWLALAPVVALWLSRELGLTPTPGMRDIERTWEEFALSSVEPLTTELVIAGRKAEVEAVHGWLRHTADVHAVRGDSTDEASAFLYSAIDALPGDDREKELSRCIVVDGLQQFRDCAEAFEKTPLIIVVPNDCRPAVGWAVRKGHHVFLCVEPQAIGGAGDVRLSRPRRGVVEEALKKMGLSDDKAQKFTRDFGHSIPVLRRHLSRSNAVSAPAWASADSAQALLPILLAGAWTEEKEGDQEVIQMLSGSTHEEYTKVLSGFLQIEDSPIRKVGKVWTLKAPLDAWFLLAGQLTDASLKSLGQVVHAVLTQTDPKYDLPADKRWSAAIYGKSNRYSEWIRTGLVESLVLLAVHGERASQAAAPQAFANTVVKDVLESAKKWEMWASLNDVLPLIAEAAPDAFLDAIEKNVKENPVLFEELMQDDASMFGECKHAGLLWGLESLAWSTTYFSRAAQALMSLGKIDKGGRFANRPMNSLGEVFLPGLPQTHASPKDRLAVFDVLVGKDHQSVWGFSKNYFNGGAISESHRFRWRASGGDRRGLESEDARDYKEYMEGLLPRLSSLASLRENIVSSHENFLHLSPSIKDRLITTLLEMAPDTFSKTEREQLLQNVRNTLNWINSYGEGKDRQYVEGLSKILTIFEPKETLERVGWLLETPWPTLPQGETRSYEEKQAEVKAAQLAAAREILDQVPLKNILEYANALQHVGIFGFSLGCAIRDAKEDEVVLEGILKNADHNSGLVKGYALGRVEKLGAEWVDQQIVRLQALGGYSDEDYALLYFGLPEGAETWVAVSASGKGVEDAYWKQARGFSRTDKTEDAELAVEKLLDAKRPLVALDVAGDPKLSISSQLLKRLIQEILAIDPEDEKVRFDTMASFHLAHVFNQLYKQGELSLEEIAMLEWPFAALLDDIQRHSSVPTAIHRLLQKEPKFFAQLVSFAYKRDDFTPDPGREGLDEKKAQNMARNAHEVLRSWRLFPGLKDDGSLDEKDLRSWVDQARQLCAATKYVKGGDLQIAEMFAYAPSDLDGTWPHVAVRNIIEDLNNELINKHIQTGVYNSRGVVSRSMNDGGAQERKLAQKYRDMSEAVNAKWPRTGALLRSIAEAYEQQAKHEDVTVELYDLRF